MTQSTSCRPSPIHPVFNPEAKQARFALFACSSCWGKPPFELGSGLHLPGWHARIYVRGCGAHMPYPPFLRPRRPCCSQEQGREVPQDEGGLCAGRDAPRHPRRGAGQQPRSVPRLHYHRTHCDLLHRAPELHPSLPGAVRARSFRGLRSVLSTTSSCPRVAVMARPSPPRFVQVTRTFCCSRSTGTSTGCTAAAIARCRRNSQLEED